MDYGSWVTNETQYPWPDARLARRAKLAHNSIASKNPEITELGTSETVEVFQKHRRFEILANRPRTLPWIRRLMEGWHLTNRADLRATAARAVTNETTVAAPWLPWHQSRVNFRLVCGCALVGIPRRFESPVSRQKARDFSKPHG